MNENFNELGNYHMVKTSLLFTDLCQQTQKKFVTFFEMLAFKIAFSDEITKAFLKQNDLYTSHCTRKALKCPGPAHQSAKFKETGKINCERCGPHMEFTGSGEWKRWNDTSPGGFMNPVISLLKGE